jgi:FAD/FMN-containing dehydrogenase
MLLQGLDRNSAEAVWRPFLDWLAGRPKDFTLVAKPQIAVIPARQFWNPKLYDLVGSKLIAHDDRPHAPPRNFFWAGNRGEAGQFLHAYRSAWLPARLLEKEHQRAFADALFAASQHSTVSLHFNKGLAGAPAEELAAAKDTATNPAVLDAIALAIVAGESAPAFPGVPGHEPNLAAARRSAEAINKAMNELLKVVQEPGSYVSESDYFERDWQRSFWGSNYPRLAAAKQRYDPDGLFFVHHGVGSEQWSADGFRRIVPH